MTDKAHYPMRAEVRITVVPEAEHRYGLTVGETGYIYSVTAYKEPERVTVYAVCRNRNGRIVRIPESGLKPVFAARQKVEIQAPSDAPHISPVHPAYW